MSEKQIAVVGLDTSHTVEFTKLIQHPEHKVVEGMRVAKAVRFPSAFQTEEGQDERQAALEQMGVTMAPTVEAAVEGMDAIFLEINDPALHLEYYEKVVGLGVPIFIDKPLAASREEGRRIAELSEKHNAPTWSASSLRFIPSLQEAKQKLPTPMLGQTFGALGKAPRGSSLIWYGVHAVEMLVATMGEGAASVRAIDDGSGIVLSVKYADERRGLVECRSGAYVYGGRVQLGGDIAFFQSGIASPYIGLMSALRDFAVARVIPVPLSEAQEVLAILECGEKSLTEDREVTL